ncbi:calsenilin-like [Tropilaelaps mercedesae]|uniref:Calsenilin-like n=1 Tax=Tropilaelaps mercedesae TaxID=418985 RepID=A0A1V9XVJ5_9ACAR|nr:calsenilin-like [Tropilaelaps mercedesae]
MYVTDRKLPGTPKEKLRWTFNLYDINGDGRITRDEMMDIIYSVYSLNADRERKDGLDGEDKHSSSSEAPQLHANRVFQVGKD